MPLSPFGYSGGIKGAFPLGAYEQALLIECVYYNRQDIAEQILAVCGGGRVVQWVRSELTVAPSWAVLAQGRHYYVVVEGTTQTDQVVIHLAGAIATSFKHGEAPNVGAHALHQQVEIYLRDLIFPAIDVQPDTEVSFSGHSYGGAIAHLLMWDATESVGLEHPLAIPRDRLHLLTLGQPRTMTAGAHEFNNDYQRIVHDGDWIPALPPAPAELALIRHKLKASRGNEWEQQWGHYGTYSKLSDEGFLYLSGNEDSLILDGATIAAGAGKIQSLHAMEVYLRKLSRAAQGSKFDPERVALLLTLDKTLSEGAPAPAWILPPQASYITPVVATQVYPGPADQPITAADIPGAQNQAFSLSSVHVGATGNIGERKDSMGSRYWKITGFLGNTETGDSVTSVLKTDDQVTISAVNVLARKWLVQRSNLFGYLAADYAAGNRSLSSPAFTYMRITDALVPRNGGQPAKLGGNQFMGPGISGDHACDRLSTSLVLVMRGKRDSSTVYGTANHVLVGIPDECVVGGVFVGSAVTLGNGKTFSAQLKLYESWLTDDKNGSWGFMGADDTNTRRPTGVWTLGSDGLWVVPCDTTGWSKGDTVVLTGQNARGMDGESTIDIQVAPLQGIILTTKRLRTDVPAPTKGFARRIGIVGAPRPRGFYRYQGFTQDITTDGNIRVSKKNLGKEFSPVSFRGHRRARV